VFKAMLEIDPGIPSHQPRLIRLDEPDLHCVRTKQRRENSLGRGRRPYSEGLALQGIWSCRRAPSTVAASDEVPREACAASLPAAYSPCCARNPMNEPAREGANDRKMGEYFC
jgi:hypothetical protein